MRKNQFNQISDTQLEINNVVPFLLRKKVNLLNIREKLISDLRMFFCRITLLLSIF